MDAEEFLKLSTQIIGLGPAGARSAISRAYYGVFHAALSVLGDLASAPPANGSSHALVPQFLQCAQVPSAIDAARLLSDLHGDRTKADYRLERRDVEAMDYAQFVVYTANEILVNLRTLREICHTTPAVRQQLQDGIARIKSIRRIP